MPPEAETAADWFALASRELEFLQTITDEFPEMILLHAQQVVEKSIKAVIWSTGTRPPFVHSIETLLAHVPSSMRIPPLVERSVWLSEAYLTTRYYADEPTPTAQQLEEGRTAAEVAVDWARTSLN